MGSRKFLLIGYGNASHGLIPTILEHADIGEITVVRACPQKPADEFTVYSSVTEALIAFHPDIAIISSPHAFHYVHAKQCIEFGCHVLVEKPAALRLADVEELVDLANRKGVLLVEGLQRRYEGLAHVYHRIVNDGRLGKPQFIHGLFAHRFELAGLSGWRNDPAIAGAGIVDDSAIHLVDLLMYFAGGRAHDVNANVLIHPENGLAHTFMCFFRTDSGVTLSASGSYLSPVQSVQEEISVWGGNGALFSRRFCIDWNAEPPLVWYKSADGKIQEQFDLSCYQSGKTLPIEALLGVLEGRSSRDLLVSEVKDTLESHRLIEAIRRTVRQVRA